jgi:hypothetical protein
MRQRIIAFLVGVPVITILYTICLIVARGSDWRGDPNSLVDAAVRFLLAVFFKPAYYLSLALPRVAQWQHALGIVFIMGALWGVAVVGLTFGIIDILRKRKTTQQGAAPLPPAPQTEPSEGAR